jgi:hypothetical protein
MTTAKNETLGFENALLNFQRERGEGKQRHDLASLILRTFYDSFFVSHVALLVARFTIHPL